MPMGADSKVLMNIYPSMISWSQRFIETLESMPIGVNFKRLMCPRFQLM